MTNPGDYVPPELRIDVTNATPEQPPRCSFGVPYCKDDSHGAAAVTDATTPEQPRTAAGRALYKEIDESGWLTAGPGLASAIKSIEADAQAHPAAAPGAPRQRRSSRAWGLLNRWASWAKPITGLSKKSWEVLLTDTLAYLDEPEDEAARPAVASKGLRAALLELVKWGEALPGGIPEVTPFGWDNLRACIEQARAALASDAGSAGALDVERLERALHKGNRNCTWEHGQRRCGWDSPVHRSDANTIRNAYDAERQGES